MKFLTNLTAATIDAYNVMNWNHGEDIYCLAANGGDCWREALKDAYAEDPNYLVDAALLQGDTEWQIEKHETLLEEGEEGAAHEWWLDGDRDKRTMAGYYRWKRGRKEIASYKRELARWLKRVVTCEPRWVEMDDVVIHFKGNKAVLKKGGR